MFTKDSSVRQLDYVDTDVVNTARVAKQEGSVYNSPTHHENADPDRSPLIKHRATGSFSKLSPIASDKGGGFALKMQSIPKVTIQTNAAERDKHELKEAKQHKREFVQFVSNILTKHKEPKNPKDALNELGNVAGDNDLQSVDEIANFITDKVTNVIKPVKKNR